MDINAIDANGWRLFRGAEFFPPLAGLGAVVGATLEAYPSS